MLLRALLVLFIVGFLGSGFLVLWAAQLNMPDFDSFNERKVVQSTKIYDKTGKVLLYDVNGAIRRTVVNYEDMSRYIKNATVAIEDREFYQHHGIKPKAIIRALITNIAEGRRAQGGSTITQQVIKNTLLTTDKSISRKLKEAFLALKLEKNYTKDEILALYLNESPYGGTIYGVEEASQAFFGKPAKEVTLAEAAYLAALPKAPTYYSPYGNHVSDLEARKNLVLREMLSLGFITKEEEAAALAEKVTFSREESKGLKAAHFVMYVLEYLEENYGREALETSGFRVITTLDYDLQKKAEEIVAQYGEENEKKYNAKNAGVIGIDPNNGDILVMVGSRDYFDTENQGNFNITLSHRQPGSTFKPIVYASAFNKGYTPDTVVFDVPTNFSTNCSTTGVPLYAHITPDSCYMPQNYDGLYRGPMNLRSALAQSINIPAVKMLYLVGVNDALTTARAMGITSLGEAKQYGLTLVLGGGEVSPLELATAYGVFATEGIRHEATPIVKIQNLSGKVLEEHTTTSEDVLPANTARLISSVLSDNVARTPSYGANSPLYFPDRDVAVKTGTTNDYKDAWTVGYTPSFVLAAWVGNNDNKPMEKKVAGFLVAPMWNAIFTEALKKIPREQFTPPSPTDPNLKPILRGEWQNPNGVHEILHYVNKADPLGAAPSNPSSDSQYNLWETPVQNWLSGNTVTTPSNTASFSFVSPSIGVTYKPTDIISLRLSLPQTPLRVEYLFNQTLIANITSTPFEASFTPSSYPTAGANNTISAHVYLQNGSRVDTTTTLLLSI